MGSRNPPPPTTNRRSVPHPRPHDNCYWVIPGRLLAGEYPGAVMGDMARIRLERFAACGIDRFLDLTEAGELRPYADQAIAAGRAMGLAVAHQRHAIPDMGIPDAPERMQAMLGQIDDWLADGRLVYVHCWGGVGRTGTVIGCYLVRHGLTGEQALARLAECWLEVSAVKRRRFPRTPQTRPQAEYVRNWPARATPP